MPKNKRDKIEDTESSNISTRFYDKKKMLLEIIPVLILIFIFAIALYVYPKLPDKVPIHWNASGQIDNYGPKIIAVFLIPVIFLLFEIFSIILPAMDVFKNNIKTFYKYYYFMKVLFGIFFLVLYVATIMPNFGYVFNIGYVILIAVIVLFFALGYIMRFIKRNFFIGIRTPWTLASDSVWDKTHKLGGILFMITSLILMLALIFLDTMIIYIIFIVLIFIIVMVLMFYSYSLYRDEEKQKKRK